MRHPGGGESQAGDAMNKVITDGLVLMPPPFAAGLGFWSRETGRPGTATYLGAADAAFVPADQDFGGALEMLKTENVQRLRHMGETPILPGCYLRIRVRIKGISGNLPRVRIAAWAGTAAGVNLTGVVQTGPEVQLASFGEVVTLEAIVGTGTRQGVDMPWGTGAVFGHFGLDLLGDNGGVVRIDDIEIEDATGVFLRKLMDWVDVRDWGARGDGVTDDHAAFVAADAEALATGQTILVPEGSYRIGSTISVQSRIRFQGSLAMPVEARLSLMQNYDLPSYIEAFGGDEPLAFRKAVQALMNFTDHESLDMGGRRVQLDGPIDMQAAVNDKTVFEVRRVIRNGQLEAQPGPAWNDTVVSAQASYDPAFPTRLSNVANPAQIAIGSLVSGNGVGREVYVRSRNDAAGHVFLSQPLFAATGTQVFSFRRFKYLLDFSGFAKLSQFVLDSIEFQCNGLCSGIMLAPEGRVFQVRDSQFARPKDRGISSIGTGCQDLHLERNQWLSNEQSVPVQNRSTIGFNINANDGKLRDNQAMRFLHWCVLHGSGHLISGNHFFQGDDIQGGVRSAGLILTQPNVLTTISGNYIDNCWVEWTNEHDEAPDFGNEFSFGGLSLTNNNCTAIGAPPSFSWLVVKPHGPGHFIQGLNLSDNVFRPINGAVDRVERIDTTFADLDRTRMRNIVVEGNSFNAVSRFIANPVVIDHSENSAQSVWVVDLAGRLPFDGRARVVSGLVPQGAITNAAGAAVFAQPFVQVEQGAGGASVTLNWPEAVKGRARVEVRMDNPA